MAPPATRSAGPVSDDNDDGDGDQPSMKAMTTMFAKIMADAQMSAAAAQTAALKQMSDQHAATLQLMVDAQQANTGEVKRASDARGSRKAKLPTWSPDISPLWFQLVDSTFASEGVTSDLDRFNQTVAHLPPAVVASLCDFIKNPPDTNKYPDFKQAVIAATKLPRAERFRLFLESSLGDRKPTEFLQYLYTLNPQALVNQDEFFRQNLLNKLPTTIWESLSVRDELSIKDLADMADKLMGEKRASGGGSGVNWVDDDDAIYFIKRFGNNSFNKSVKPQTKDGSDSGRCYFHKKFGKLATKCEQPC